MSLLVLVVADSTRMTRELKPTTNLGLDTGQFCLPAFLIPFDTRVIEIQCTVSTYQPNTGPEFPLAQLVRFLLWRLACLSEMSDLLEYISPLWYAKPQIWAFCRDGIRVDFQTHGVLRETIREH